MTDTLSGLLSATFVEPGYDHIVELVHQKDTAARRHLASLDIAAFSPAGKLLGEFAIDPRQETLDLAGLLGEALRGCPRVMALFDARYEPARFPYRPHHYAYFHRRGSSAPPLYYAVNAVLGGVPERIGATRTNHFETYLFLSRPLEETYSVMLGNSSRFATAEGQVIAYHGAARTAVEVVLPPKGHAEVPIAASSEGQRLARIELKAGFRLASYVVGRRPSGGDLVLFDHLFTSFQ